MLVAAGCARTRVATPLFPPSTPAALILVAWNLDAGRGDVPRLLDDLASGRLAGVTAPDAALLLQEAPEEPIARLAGERGLHLWFGAVRDNDGAAMGNAILSTRPLTDVRVIPLPRERQPRSAAFARIALRGTPIFLVSVHLENRVSLWRGGLISDRARGRQAEALLQALPPDSPGIVGGDLNTWLGPTEPAWRLLAGRFDDTPPEPSLPTFADRLVLDHLFFDLPAGWRAARAVVPERYGSNHHPVVGLVFGVTESMNE